MSEGRKENLVQFMCCGKDISDRKSCASYVKDEDEDCAGLKNPVTKERNGICWSPKALFMKSAAFLQFWDAVSAEDKPVEPHAEEE